MIKGIGVDILSRKKLDPILDDIKFLEDPFIKKTYTLLEIDEALQREDTKAYFATRFAGKEAVYKALSLEGDDMKLDEIEILTTSSGAPAVLLYGKALEVAEARGIGEVLLSLSYEDDYAVAYAVAQ